MDFLQHWSSKSPLLTVLAVVFLLQPVISTTVDLIDEWRSVKQDMDPGARPVTKNELDIVNKKIDFLQDLILEEMDKQPKPAAKVAKVVPTLHQHIQLVDQPTNSPVEPPSPLLDNRKDALKGLQDQLSTVQKQLDDAWKKQPKK